MHASVFVSHASADRKIADTICAALESRGVPCWIATRDVPPGENFGDTIAAAIRASRVMVLVFSDSANNSDEIKKEVVLAGRGHVPVIPLRVEDIQPSGAFEYELVTRQWIDLFVNWDQAIERLMRQIEQIIGRARPTSRSDAARIAPAVCPGALGDNTISLSPSAISGPGTPVRRTPVDAAAKFGAISGTAAPPVSDSGTGNARPGERSRPRWLTPWRLGLFGMALVTIVTVAVLARNYGLPEADAAALYSSGNAAYDRTDYAAAMIWYRKAADQGYTAAQVKIGSLYENGQGVPKDSGMAREWMAKAANAGDASARAWLATRQSPAVRCDVANPPVACLFKTKE